MPVVCASQVTLGSSQAHFGDGVSVHLQPCAGAMFCCCESTPEVTVEVHSSPVLDEVGLPTRGRHEATNVPDVDPFLSDVQKWKKQKDIDIVHNVYIYLRNPLPSFFWVIKIKPGFPQKTYVFSKWYFNHCNQEPSRKEG